MSYSDKCQNSEPGWFNGECGKPTKWYGTHKTETIQSFCDDCKNRGWEAKGVVSWEPALDDIDDFNYVGSRHHY